MRCTSIPFSTPHRVVFPAQVVPERAALLPLDRLLRRLTAMEAARSSLSSSQSGLSRRICSSTLTTTMSRCIYDERDRQIERETHTQTDIQGAAR